jgi:hypothetical protein
MKKIIINNKKVIDFQIKYGNIIIRNVTGKVTDNVSGIK